VLSRGYRPRVGQRVPLESYVYPTIEPDFTHLRVGLLVIASARSRDTLIDLEELGISTVSLEVTSAESREVARKEVEKLTGGKLDILVNNALVLTKLSIWSI